MQPQLAFSWRSPAVAAMEDDEERHAASPRRDPANGRRVTFAVHNVPPSPLVYHAHHRADARNENEDRGGAEDDRSRDKMTSSSGARPRRPPPPANRTVPTKNTATVAAYSTKAAPRPRARPGWDNHVSRDGNLFDAALKKTALFQARPGDRKRDVNDQEESMREQRVSISKRSTKVLMPSTGRPLSARPSEKPRKWRATQSSGYMSRSSFQLPPKPRKDYVKENIERMAGRSMDMLRSNKPQSRLRHPRSVFERLTVPRATDAPLRSRAHAPSLTIGTEVEKDGALKHSTTNRPAVHNLPSPQSPQALETMVSDSDERDRSGQARFEPKQRGNASYDVRQSTRSNSDRIDNLQSTTRSFLQPSGFGSTFHRSVSPRSSPTSGRSHNSSERRQPSYAARVFAVLDRDERRRIGVDQVLQGLRLLGLPATHNQISDYIYLIHEGKSSTIDLEEWEILVGTLDAASRPSDSAASLTRVETSSDRSAFSLSSPDRVSARGLLSPHSSRPKNSTHTPSRSSPSYLSDDLIQQHYQERLNVDGDISDPAVQTVQAGAAASLHWTPAPSKSNQIDDDTSCPTRHVLNSAAAVVYNLKASLFPLVHQAEETLKKIRQRQGYKLSVVLSPDDLRLVARNSEVLASAILDDVLLDTVQLLNDEEKCQSQRQVAKDHADQLDDILHQIQQIEQDELNMLKQQASTATIVVNEATCSVWEEIDTCHKIQTTGAFTRDGDPKMRASIGQDISKLVLPLGVVMNVKVSSEAEQSDPDLCKSRDQANIDTVRSPIGIEQALRKHLTLIQSLPAIRTSILQGKRLQSIEKRRTQFLKHRRLAEAALADTGMTQSAVIEILEEMLVSDVVEEAVFELEDTVGFISDTVVTNLL